MRKSGKSAKNIKILSAYYKNNNDNDNYRDGYYCRDDYSVTVNPPVNVSNYYYTGAYFCVQSPAAPPNKMFNNFVVVNVYKCV